MSAVLRLYASRDRGPTLLVVQTADGAISITWQHRVDPHELVKARACGSASKPWRDVLDAVTSAVDCQSAIITYPAGER